MLQSTTAYNRKQYTLKIDALIKKNKVKYKQAYKCDVDMVFAFFALVTSPALVKIELKNISRHFAGRKQFKKNTQLGKQINICLQPIHFQQTPTKTKVERRIDRRILEKSLVTSVVSDRNKALDFKT